MQTCYRHPSRETGVSCSSCGRPICTDCMVPTSVGMRCPECAKQRTQVRTAATLNAAAEPRVSYAIIALNVIVFVAEVLGGGGATRDKIASAWVYQEGALNGFLVHDGEWWRIIASGFLHADPLHLIFNMIGVYFLGQFLEPALGAVRYVALYVGALLVGSLGVLVLSPEATTIGASGAVFGLFGAAFVLLRGRGFNPFQTILGPILLINLLGSFRPGISLGAHLGGLLGGVLCAMLLGIAEQRGRRQALQLGVAGCALIGALAIIGGIVASGSPGLYAQ